MKTVRNQHGVLSLETPVSREEFEARTGWDRPDEKNRAKELIEDFMIAANSVAAAVDFVRLHERAT